VDLITDNIVNYDNTIKTLKKKKYREVSEGEFIVLKDSLIGQGLKLVVRKVNNLKQELKELEHAMKAEYNEVELDIKKFGIIFSDNNVSFLIQRSISLNEIKIEKIKKDLNKLSPAFIKKYKKVLKKPHDLDVWDSLFDRMDIIEDFYVLYIKARENILHNLSGIYDDRLREEFADNLLMQMLIIWYLQEKGFLDGDTNYLINKFCELPNSKFDSYYDFLINLFEVMMSEPNDGIFHNSENIGKIAVTGPAPFLNGNLEKLPIPDRIFYSKGLTAILKKIDPKNASDVKILNLLESRDWTEGNIDEFVLGAIFEKLMTAVDRKEKGAFYTPEPITEYVCKFTIKSYLIDKINEKFNTIYKNLDDFFENNEIEEHYKFLFDEMKRIKILDPSCGSGHFLETTINVLVDIYEIIRNKAKKFGFSYETFSIFSIDLTGRLVKNPLIGINEKEERILKLKFHIIISRNIYGIDILPSAIKVARARLFLSLAKHFDAKKGIYIRFPNVHFNTRVGNSIIGFTTLNIFEKINKQATLQKFLQNERGEPFKMELSEELVIHIKNVDKKLNSNTFNLFLEVKDQFKQPLTKKRLKKALNLRSDLIKILLISLNTEYAIKLKEIIDELTSRFNFKLNKEFFDHFLFDKNININGKSREKISYFHWIMEFSEVFFNKKGFDIIIGNPPHGNILTDYEKEWVKSNHQFSQPRNVAEVFLERCYNLLKVTKRLGFVIPKSIAFYVSWGEIRKLILSNTIVERILDMGLGFIGVVAEQLGVILKKISVNEVKLLKDNSVFIDIAEPLRKPTTYKRIEHIGQVPQSFMQYHNILIFRPFNPDEIEILDYINKSCIKFRDIYEEVFRGLYIPDKKKEKLEKGKIIWVDKVPFIGKYYITNLQGIMLTNKKWIEKADKILKPRIFFKVFRGSRIVCFIDERGELLTTEKLVNVVLPNDSKINLYALMAVMNSTIPSFYLQKMLFSETTETSRVMDDPYIGEIPLQTEIFNSQILEIFVKYLLFLNSTEERREKLSEIINFIKDELINSLVYKLYFSHKFQEDNLKVENLSALIHKKIKEIKYNIWLTHFREKQLNNNSFYEENDKLDEIEDDISKSINTGVFLIKSDKKIMEMIGKIKSHPWVKIIEEKV